MAEESYISDELTKKIGDFAREAVSFVDGAELVDLTFYKQYGKLNVEAFLWKKAGISLDDCEKVHNALSSLLDTVEDEFSDDYVLNVSSSGLDRKIVSDDDFRRALDTEIECFDSQKKKLHGVLVGYDADSITLKTDGNKPKEITLTRKSLTKVQPYISF